MAVLFITEFSDATLPEGRIAAGHKPMPPVAEQTVAIGGGTLQSAAFNAATNMIRVHADVVCSVSVGANPTATATTMRIPANGTEYFRVTPGQKIAVITNT